MRTKIFAVAMAAVMAASLYAPEADGCSFSLPRVGDYEAYIIR